MLKTSSQIYIYIYIYISSSLCNMIVYSAVECRKMMAQREDGDSCSYDGDGDFFLHWESPILFPNVVVQVRNKCWNVKQKRKITGEHMNDHKTIFNIAYISD